MKTLTRDEFNKLDFICADSSASIEIFKAGELVLNVFRGDENEHFWVDPVNFRVSAEGAESEDMSDGFLNIDARPEICFEYLDFSASDKTDIAREFIALHKNDSLPDWQPRGLSDHKKLLVIYGLIIDGTYGECRETGGGGAEIEVSKFESKSKQSILFEFNLVR